MFVLSNSIKFFNDFIYGFIDGTQILSPYLGKDFRWWVRWKCDVQIKGLENIPKKGPFIVAGNHLKMQSGLIRPVYDAFIMSMIIYEHAGENIRWLARPTMAFDIPRIGRKIPLPLRDVMLNIFEYKYGALMIDTSLGDKAKFKITADSIEALEQGDVVGLMPEGDLYDALAKAKKGLFYIASGYNKKHPDAPVKVLPIAAWGMEKEVLGKKRKVQVRICKPITISPTEEPQSAVDRVMVAIAEKLPQRYRGYYRSSIKKF